MSDPTPQWKIDEPMAVSEQDAHYRAGVRRLEAEGGAQPIRPLAPWPRRLITAGVIWFAASYGVYVAATWLAATAEPQLARGPQVAAKLALYPNFAGGLFAAAAIVVGLGMTLRAWLRKRRRASPPPLTTRIVRYVLGYLALGGVALALAAAMLATATIR